MMYINSADWSSRASGVPPLLLLAAILLFPPMTKHIRPLTPLGQTFRWAASMNRLRASALLGSALFGLDTSLPRLSRRRIVTPTLGPPGPQRLLRAARPSWVPSPTPPVARPTRHRPPRTTRSPSAAAPSYAATDDIANLMLTGGLTFGNTAGTVTINNPTSNGEYLDDQRHRRDPEFRRHHRRQR